MTEDIFKRVLNVQTALVAPKSQFNSFGKYKYRRAEDILEALKPLLKENELTLAMNDEPVIMGDRFYIKATVTVYHEGDSFSVSAFAREGDSKAGMDPAQITGATSSYARKYALGGMFCIDDNADPDVTNTHGADTTATAKKGSKKGTETPSGAPTLDDAIKALNGSKTREELDTVWNTYPQFQFEQSFIAAANEIFAKVNK